VGSSLNKTNQNKLIIFQKKIIRIITKSTYNAHTNPLFKDLKLLKFLDIIDLETSKFIYLASKGRLPSSLNNMFTLNCEVHEYETRNKNNPRTILHKSTIFNNSFLGRGPALWAKLSNESKNKKTIKSFSKNLKCVIIDSY